MVTREAHNLKTGNALFRFKSGARNKIKPLFIFSEIEINLEVMNFCKYCGKEIPKNQKFCSKHCNRSFHNQERGKLKAEAYEKAPKFCKCCGKKLPYKYLGVFCDSSCSAKYNNTHRVRSKKDFVVKGILKQRKELQKKADTALKSNIPAILRCKYCGKLVTHGTCCSECREYVQNIRACAKVGITEGSLKERFENLVGTIYEKYYVEKLGLIQTSKVLGLNQTTIRRVFQKANIPLRTNSEGVLISFEQGRSRVRENPAFNTGTHISFQGRAFRYRSSWELKYMEYLDSKKIPYEYEFRYFRYFDSVQKKERLACPDFYLPETNEIVELKSTYTIQGKVQELKDKFKVYKEEGFKPKLLLDWKFVDLNTL